MCLEGFLSPLPRRLDTHIGMVGLDWVPAISWLGTARFVFGIRAFVVGSAVRDWIVVVGLRAIRAWDNTRPRDSLQQREHDGARHLTEPNELRQTRCRRRHGKDAAAAAAAAAAAVPAVGRGGVGGAIADGVRRGRGRLGPRAEGAVGAVVEEQQAVGVAARQPQ